MTLEDWYNFPFSQNITSNYKIPFKLLFSLKQMRSRKVKLKHWCRYGAFLGVQESLHVYDF